jgi:hypothetical protein
MRCPAEPSRWENFDRPRLLTQAAHQKWRPRQTSTLESGRRGVGTTPRRWQAVPTAVAGRCRGHEDPVGRFLRSRSNLSGDHRGDQPPGAPAAAGWPTRAAIDEKLPDGVPIDTDRFEAIPLTHRTTQSRRPQMVRWSPDHPWPSWLLLTRGLFGGTARTSNPTHFIGPDEAHVAILPGHPRTGPSDTRCRGGPDQRDSWWTDPAALLRARVQNQNCAMTPNMPRGRDAAECLGENGPKRLQAERAATVPPKTPRPQDPPARNLRGNSGPAPSSHRRPNRYYCPPRAPTLVLLAPNSPTLFGFHRNRPDPRGLWMIVPYANSHTVGLSTANAATPKTTARLCLLAAGLRYRWLPESPHLNRERPHCPQNWIAVPRRSGWRSQSPAQPGLRLKLFPTPIRLISCPACWASTGSGGD